MKPKKNILIICIFLMTSTAIFFIAKSKDVLRLDTTSTKVSTQKEPALILEEKEEGVILESKGFVVRPGQSRLSYTQALDLYSYSLLQFTQDCQLSSGIKSFGLNNEVMIDNRSSKPNTFTVGSNSLVVGPYDFGFMILKEKGTSISVSCDNRKNIATLNVQ
jgi:hypothetical protein